MNDFSGNEKPHGHTAVPQDARCESPPSAETEALTAYVILARDWCEYLDYVGGMSLPGRELLKTMLTTVNPKHDRKTQELNTIGAKCL